MLSPLGYGSNTNTIPYLVRSTSIPDSSIEEAVIPFPGIPYKMAGTRTYGDWTVSFNIDTEGILLDNFHNWHDLMYDKNHLSTSPKSYMRNQQLYLIDGRGYTTRKFELYNAWPKSIGAVGLDYSSGDIATMDVTFSYQYYKTGYVGDEKSSLLTAAVNRLTGSALSVFQ